MAQDALAAKMRDLGMKPTPTADGELEGQAPFRSLVNAFSRAAILAATVRSYRGDSVRCVAPVHLTHLPAIRILELADAAAFEAAVQNAYAWRLEKLREANEFLAAMKLKAELDEPGFRVVSTLKVGGEDVRFTLRHGGVAQLLAIAGKTLDGVDPRQRRTDVHKCRSSVEVAKKFADVIAVLRRPKFEVEAEKTEERSVPSLANAPRPVSKRATNELFDHSFAGDLSGEGEESMEQTLGSQSMGAVDAPSDELPDKTEGSLVAVVCASCKKFYLVSQEPPDRRLLENCEDCVAMAG